MNRRQVIAAVLAGSLAGCTGLGGDDEETDTDRRDGDGEATETGQPDTDTPDGETETPSATPTDTMSESGDGSDGESTVESGNDEVDEFLSDVSNYDGIDDRTGESEATVEVGVQTDRGYYGFGPAAIRIDAATTVTWEWTGRGGGHNVVAEEGADFQSERVTDEGHTFSHTFEEPGNVLYLCTPHSALEMKGAVVVE